MSIATQINLPPMYDPIMKMENGQMVTSQEWLKWFNSLYEILSTNIVAGRNDALVTDSRAITIPFIQLASHTTALRDTVGAPTNGLIFYNETIPAVQARVGGAWVNL